VTSKLLLTGASGFVGRRLASGLIEQNADLICSVRERMHIAGADCRVVADLGPTTDWRHCLDGVVSVIHCAARVHVLREREADPLRLFREVNVAGTLALAEQAATAGVQRFIFLSSVKVNGETTSAGHPFSEECAPRPVDPYGISKFEAEQALFDLGRRTGMAITVIRPPLVYGPGVGANFLSMLQWVQRGTPLPFGSIRNRRSFVYVENLVSLITCCVHSPSAENQVFLVSDGCDMSTPELLRKCATSLSVISRLFPCPPSILIWMARLAGRRSVADRLCRSLQVDIGKARRVLGWAPPYTVEQGLNASTHRLIGKHAKTNI
jgi:nucleoside-diphosphate-sugar epimerase